MATVVVTGPTGAIGAATVAALQKRRAQVIGLSRPVLDLSSIASVRAAARELNRTAGHIDALLNIASVFTSRYQKSVDGFELMLATNHLGPFLLTNLLRDRLASGGRVITVTAPSTTQVNIDRHLGLVLQGFATNRPTEVVAGRNRAGGPMDAKRRPGRAGRRVLEN